MQKLCRKIPYRYREIRREREKKRNDFIHLLRLNFCS